MNNNESKLLLFGFLLGSLGGASAVMGYIAHRDSISGSTSESEEFVHIGKRMLRWIANYRLNVIKTLPVISTVQPNYLSKHIGNVAPDSPESWDCIFNDIDTAIVVRKWLYNENVDCKSNAFS